MDDSIAKGPSPTTDFRTSIELANAYAVSEKHGTHGDEMDMDRMGKLQVLRRQFKFLSIFGFAVILGNTWEYSLLYVIGWLCVIAWQTGMAGTAFAVAQQLQGLIALNMPDYAIQGWHGTLLSIAIVLCSILGNTILVKKLPLMEGLALVLHVFGFFAFLVVLWVMGPRSNVHDTWTKFEDPSGWGNTGLATLVGVLGPILSLGSADLAIHLAEEVEEASYNIPRAMIATSAVNYTFAFVMTVTVFSTLGNDVMAIMSTPFGQPWIQILMNATESIVATNILTVVVCLLLLFASVNQVTAASR
ncbi:unnamed protein product [Alternaria alternata]